MKLNRRKFIKHILLGIAAIEGFFLIKGSIGENVSNDTSEKLFEVGDISNFQENKIYPFLEEHFYLRRYTNGGFLAMSVKCTHLGCVINPKSKQKGFECPCHSSQYDEYGQVTSPPAFRPLSIFPIIIKNNKILVDTSREIKRNKFDKSQLTFA